MKGDIFKRLNEISQGDKKKSKLIAKWLLEYEGSYRDLKISDITSDINCSSATLVRFANNLGFVGFAELKHELSNQKDRYEGIESDKLTIDNYQNQLEQMFDSFRKTIILNEEKKFNSLINKIIESDKISLYAMGETAIVALDFQLKLIRIGIDASCFLDRHTQIFSSYNLTEDSLAIGFSYSGMTHQVLENLKLAKQMGATTFLICRSGVRVDDYVDNVLYVESLDSISRVYSTTSRFAMLFLMDLIYHHLLLTDSSYYDDRLKKTRQIKK